ncbi:MAG: B12-binding domain-containing radical SAM protein, partial [Candidatus Parcubacteria bacterium]|nr:B12-binding domain-containing radical SAM protein [Candidatus Parcubacteria bacterium]
MKAPEQFLRELDAVYQAGHRGPIMLADDNFIGNRKKVREMLPQLIKWQQDHRYPFDFTVEADITLADDHDLMKMMVSAGIKKVFLGLETPNTESLVECGKMQNATRDMAACVKEIQNCGLNPMSGFIVGFDADNPDTIFDQHLQFYRETGIVFPMIGILQAPLGTRLHARLEEEGRLLSATTGNNTDITPN